jgi:translocation and assembly module TamB
MSFKKTIVRIVVGLAVVVALVASTGVLLLRSARFQRYLATKVEREASAALGTQVHIDSLNLELLDLKANLGGISVLGALAPRETLLYVPHLELKFKILSLFRLQWNLHSITIDHPVVRVLTGKNGEANIPHPQHSGSFPGNVFDLAVQRAVIEDGTIYYNNLERELSAELHDVRFHAIYDNAVGGRYEGTLEYRQGKLSMVPYRALTHDLGARFTLTRTTLTFNPLVFTSGASRLEFAASVANFTSPHLTARYQATLAASDVSRVVNSPTVAQGTVRLGGTIDYQYETGRPAIESIALAGDLNSELLKVQSPRFRTAIRAIRARYSIVNGNTDVPELHARLLGGGLDGELTTRSVHGQAQSHMQAKLSGISLNELELLAPAAAVKGIRLTGRMNGKLEARWERAIQDLVAALDVSISGQAGARATTAGASVPIDADVHGSYVAAKQQVSLSNSFLRTRQTSLRAYGTMDHHSSLKFSLQSGNLRDLDPLVSLLSARNILGPSRPLDLSGTASFAGEMRGTTTSPTISGRLTGADIHVRGALLHAVRANLEVSPSKASVEDGHLELDGQGVMDLSGKVNLMDWSYIPENGIALTVRVSQLPASQIARLVGRDMPVSGVIDANASVHGTALNPFGQGRVLLTNAEIFGEKVRKAELELQGAGEEFTGTLDLRLLAGPAHGNFTYYPKQLGYSATLQASNLQLDKLHVTRAERTGVSGILNVEVHGMGTLEDPAWEARLAIPELHIQDRQIRNLQLRADVNHQKATIELSSEAEPSAVQAHGTILLRNGYDADMQLDTGLIPLQTLAALYVPARASDFGGHAELHATLKGPLKTPQLLEGHAFVQSLAAKYKSYELTTVNPIQIDYRDEAIEVQRGEIRGPGTTLAFQGRFPMNQPASATGLLVGTVNLNVLQAIDPAIRAGGLVEIDIHSQGIVPTPGLEGEIRIVNASVAAEGMSLGMRNGTGLLKLNNHRIAIDSFQGEVGNGTVTARGAVALSPHVQFDLTVAGKNVQVLYPEGTRSSFDADLTLTGNVESAYLRGRVSLEGISLTPDFDLSHVAAEVAERTGTPPGAFGGRIHLGVNLTTPSDVNLSGRTLSLQGGAQLQIQGTAAEPVVLGRVSVTEGDVILLSHRYELAGSTVQFANPVRTEPVLNVGATTIISDYTINVRLEGPPDRLRTNYSSDPSLPPVDIINLLAFGRTTESGEPSPFGGLGAESLLVSGISSEVSSRVQRLLGFSQLSVAPIVSSNEEDSGARIVVGQRITSNLFVTFSADVTSTLSQVITVRYQLSPRWSMAGEVNENGGVGFSARLRKEF